MDWELSLDGIGHKFGPRTVFKDISFSVNTGSVIAVSGPNGSGKSTLLRIAAGLTTPFAGSHQLSCNGVVLSSEARRQSLGYAAPDAQLYGDLTADDHLRFFADMRGVPVNADWIGESLLRVGLAGRGEDRIRTYSSGMRHRLKLACALVGSPPLLVLDEPSSNLDRAGSEMVRQVIKNHAASGIVIIGTNEPEELDWADTVVRLGPAPT